MQRKAASKAPKKRLTLLERQQALLEKEGFAAAKKPQQAVAKKPKAKPRARSRAPSQGFVSRQEKHLLRHGRANASSFSRRAVEMELGDEDETYDRDGAQSVASAVSRAPSMHPSVAGTVVSMACSEVTIGAGDDTGRIQTDG